SRIVTFLSVEATGFPKMLSQSFFFEDAGCDLKSHPEAIFFRFLQRSLGSAVAQCIVSLTSGFFCPHLNHWNSAGFTLAGCSGGGASKSGQGAASKSYRPSNPQNSRMTLSKVVFPMLAAMVRIGRPPPEWAAITRCFTEGVLLLASFSGACFLIPS